MQRGLENAGADKTVLPSNDATLWKWSESESHLVGSDSLRPHGLYSPRNFPSQNTGVGSCSLLQGIIPTQEWNRCLLHCRWILYQLSLQESKRLKRKYQFGGNWSIFTRYKMSIYKSQEQICKREIKLTVQVNDLLPHLRGKSVQIWQMNSIAET